LNTLLQEYTFRTICAHLEEDDMTPRLSVILAALCGFACGAALIQAVHAEAKPPAYTIAEFEVTDAPTFQKYGQGTGASIPPAGGKFLVRGGKTFVLTGTPPKQIVVIQWDSLEKAQAYFESATYKQLVPMRDSGAKFRGFVVEGLPN
jgi:uncharacterized protein (DUF1330 family)